MHSGIRIGIIAMGGLVALAHTAEARAATCGALFLGAGNHDVIVGRYATWDPGINAPKPTPEVDLGVCVLEGGGQQSLMFGGCDAATPASLPFEVNTGAGNDRLVALQEVHGAWFPCENIYILPWKDTTYAFGIDATMSTGADEFYGSPEGDHAGSNTFVFGGVAAADGAADLVCGYAGKDTLQGDGDDNYTLGLEESLDGGADADVCDGDAYWTFDGSDVSDLHQGCETVQDAFLAGGSWPIDCDATSDPFTW